MDALASVVAARRGAWRWVVAAVASAALSWVVGLAAGHLPAANRVDPTYTLAGLSQVVAHDPERWMGRTVWVWGVARRYCRRVDAFSCVTQVVLTDAQSPSWTDDLVLRPPRDTAMLAVLRRLPLLGSLVPPPPVLPWGVPARYHVQLRALPRTACAACYAALLLDSAWARADVAPR